MASEINTVTLSVSSYNQIKAENYRLNLFLENLFAEAGCDPEQEKLMFDSDKVAYALNFCFSERYRKRLGNLRMENFGKEQEETPHE